MSEDKNITCDNHHEFDDLKSKLEGVGKDAEIITNENGGRESKSPLALHLVDPVFLRDWAEEQGKCVSDEEYYLTRAIYNIAIFMYTDDKRNLDIAMGLLEPNKQQALIRIAKVLQYGADRYEPNNWRLIPQESHLNHALIHILAEIMGDTQDDHIDHALCRLMMAMSTGRTPGFEYNDYVVQTGAIAEVPSSHPDFKPIHRCSYKYDCNYKEE